MPNIRRYDLVVISPGVPSDLSFIKKFYDSKIPVVAELELGWQFLSGQSVVAITGTNGKTTVTRLVEEILKRERRVCVAGNIGNPLSSEIPVEEDAIVVLEVSSFQLESIAEFRPDIAVFLNFAPDHLDRYDGIEEYLKTKAKIFQNQKKADIMILNADDYVVVNIARKSKARPYFFSRKQILQEGVFVREDHIVARFLGKEERLLKCSEIPLVGAHNLENVLASILCGMVMGVEIEDIVVAVKSFSGLPHRIEEVATVSGVRFINDSKATNVASVIAALSSFERPIILIAGGRDKGDDYSRLIPYLKEKCKNLILFGESADLIGSIVRGACEVSKVTDISQAVNLAYALAEADDVVLLSPACASFDQFTDYKERGERFAEEVKNLYARLNGEKVSYSFS
jgi:UDP-N-acetylmuramoylalanine--D-glutamate ligase